MSKTVSASDIFVWAIRYSLPYFLLLLVLSVLVTLLELGIPFLLEQIIDAAIHDEVDTSALNRYGLIMLGMIIGIYLIHHIYIRFEVKMSCLISFGMMQRIYRHIIRQPYPYFKRKKTGELIHRATVDTNEFEHHYQALLSELPYELLMIFGVIGMMLYLDPTLALVVIGFLTLTSYISTRIGRPLPALERRVQILGARFTHKLQEILQGIKTVKGFATEQQELNSLDAANQRRIEVKRTSGKVESYLLPVFDLVEVLGVMVVVWYGAHLIIQDKLTAGGLVAFIAYMEYLAGPVSRAGNYYQHWREAKGLAQRMAEFLQDNESQDKAPDCPRQAATLTSIPSLRFDRVSFHYPDTSHWVLENISFDVSKHQVLALAGRNGSGKTTIMELLKGFYRPQQGNIFAGEHSIYCLEPAHWSRRVGVMTQDVHLFNRSILENICYASNDVSPQALQSVIQLTQLESIIAKLPEGLHTIVGEKGCTLSGGERQRIALARLLLTKPEIIIYDEPSAAMDGEAVKSLARMIKDLARDRISLLISHDPQLLSMADKVLLLDNGQIVGFGTHTQLLQKYPLYRTLFDPQKNNIWSILNNNALSKP